MGLRGNVRDLAGLRGIAMLCSMGCAALVDGSFNGLFDGLLSGLREISRNGAE